MSYQPRWYQAEAIEKSVEFLRTAKNKNGLVVLPTGSGKSIVIAGIVKELNAPVLILQPSKEILAQNAAKYQAYGYKCGIYSASAGKKQMDDVTFAMIGSIVKKKHLLERFKYLLIDECHFVNSSQGMYEDLISAMNVPVLGLTATPYRLSQARDHWNPYITYSILKFLTRTNPRIFNKVVYHVQNRTLFDEGYLAKLKYYEVKTFNRYDVQKNTTGGDFSEASLRQQYERTEFYAKLIKSVRRLLEIRKNVLVFTKFTREAQMIVSNIPGFAMVSAKTPAKERDRITAMFRSGRIRGIANVGIYTTGFDYPELEAVVMAKPTLSLAQWYQIVGRGIRPHPDKDHTMIVDMGGNLSYFGKVEDLELSEEGGWHVRTTLNDKKYVLTGVPLDKKQPLATSVSSIR